MKYLITLTIVLASLSVFANDGYKVTQSHQLIWNNPQIWTGKNIEQKVLSFENATYPTADFIPFFESILEVEEGYSYNAVVENPIYIPLTTEELQLIIFFDIPTEPRVITSVRKEPLQNTALTVSVSPFVQKEGQILKLSKFDIVITVDEAAPQKATSTNNYASSSVLASGKFVKIKIQNSGVYKLSYEDLSQMGISPENVRIFGYGGAVLSQNFTQSKIDDLPEIAIWMEKGSDGIFNAGDYILFYAQGVNKWSYSSSNKMFTHTGNPYSLYGYYFVTSDAGTGKKIENAPLVTPSGTVYQISEFLDYKLHEIDNVSLLSSGKEFYGEKFAERTTYDFNFSFPNTITTNNSVKMRVDVASAADIASNFYVTLNGGQSKTISLPATSGSIIYRVGTSLLNFTPTVDDFVVSLTYSKPQNAAVGYLNYIEVNARRALTMVGSNMQFQNTDYLATGSYNTYNLTNAGSNIVIWDITDRENISKIQATRTGQTLTFSASNSSLTQYLAIDPTSTYPKPEIVGDVPNQNLHALTDIDMVILTHPIFLEESQTLADAHQKYNNLNVAVVTTEQVYNEFSSGTPDASAYRWLMKMLYDRDNDTGKTKYLLLFGRGSFDNRGITTSGNNLVLTYQSDNSFHATESYVTDDYFGIMTNTGGESVVSDKIDIALGRFPVTSKSDAQSIVNKTIEYMKNNNRSIWKNQMVFVADDGDDVLHMNDADFVAKQTASNHPAFQINKIYLDAFQQEMVSTGQSYPAAKSKLKNLINSGIFYLNYMGHASSNGWANENVLYLDDIKLLSNKNHFLCFAGTCEFVHFDVGKVSAGEYLLTNPVGGAIGVLSASRTVFANSNALLNRNFTEALFAKNSGKHYSIGQALVVAKNKTGGLNRLPYVYFGDPALKMSYPTKYNITTTRVNENTNIQGTDTLKALSINTIHGAITDDACAVNTGFNGTAYITIYDKEQTIKTLNNDNHATGGIFTYKDRPNIVFSGKTIVTNGLFEFTFMMPKDIRYNFGTGRINYYAESDSLNEAQGYFENFIIGGSSNSTIGDNEGPVIENMYLNTSSFISGDKVNETPHFIARVSDENGINTSGGGVGHDITLVVDNNSEYTYSLNGYYTSDINSYTSGTVAFTLPELSDGKHTLTLRVWDLLNNSSSASLNFIVEKGLAPIISSVVNYPNPASNFTTFRILHDRPQDILSVTLEVFDVSGRKIWTHTQSTAGNIQWDLETSDGAYLMSGLYLYRVNIKTFNSTYTSKANKLIIVKQ